MMDCPNTIYLMLVILLAAIDISYQTKCYSCLSDSIEQCLKDREIITCQKTEVCVHLEMSKEKYIKDTKVKVTRVHMFCQAKDLQCEKDCFKLHSAGYDNCKAYCCKDDLCNKGVPENSVYRGTRSRSGDTRKSSSTLFVSNNYQLILFVSFIAWLVMK